MRGHIRKRSKNSWAIVVELGRDPKTGKRKQKWQTIKGTKNDAERELRAIITRLENGSYVRPTKLTVGEYLEQWLRDYAAINTGPRTYERYSEIITAHFIPAFGALPLTSLQPQHIQASYARSLESGRRNGKGGLSALTVHKHHRVLYETLKHAVKRRLILRNPAEAVDPPRPQHKEMATLAPDEVNAFLNAARTTPYYTILYGCLYGASPERIAGASLVRH